MNRLTTIIGDKVYYSKGKYVPATLCAEMQTWEIRECIKKLAAYEDTGLEPEQVKQLNDAFTNSQKKLEKAFDDLLEYKKLEEQGLLIKLPCKVDDTVYTTFCDKVYEKTIDKIIINRFTTPRIWVETKLPFATSSLERWDIAIGKTIFATREEAEKALSEVQK